MVHEFGGVWTRQKLTVLEAYLQFYVTALKNQPFTLHYADAFAGTGVHAPFQNEDQEVLVPLEDFRGSVMTALEVSPGFDEFHFNDLNPNHASELRTIREANSEKTIHIYEQDANQFVPAFCAKLTAKDRAVLLLDPYSTQLNWETLKFVAESKKVDLWLLFPVSVILRMTPRDGAKVRPEWKSTLDRLLGDDGWERSLYKPIETPAIDDLFGDNDPIPLSERLNTKELEQWVTRRLKELFPYVAQPVPLNNRGKPLFLFYFAVSNDNPNAWRLADRAASHIIKKNLGND